MQFNSIRAKHNKKLITEKLLAFENDYHYYVIRNHRHQVATPPSVAVKSAISRAWAGTEFGADEKPVHRQDGSVQPTGVSAPLASQ